jgi:tRNA 5-methylaminomethyl-2-thiouridine biosynthesis bifunctional protein
MPVQTANVHFDASGTPISSHFDDFYFSTTDGLAQAQFVFIQSNELHSRWLAHQNHHFVIAETGFGTGLNFLATWQQFNAFKQQNPQSHPQSKLQQLHFVTVEKYPLNINDITRSLAHWPQLNELSAKLIEQYPSILPGCHRLIFDNGAVILDLWIGDVKDTLPQLFHGKSGFVDAWYLDGFAPSKNADMWCAQVFQSIATLTKKNGTLSARKNTSTSVQWVNDGLENVGFTLNTTPGFDKKCEVLTGKLIDKALLTILPPFYFRHANNSANKQVAIIGGGIASAMLTYALAKRGFDITLFCKDDTLAQGASQNRQGALYPLLHASHDSLSEFYAQAYLFAVRQYKQLLGQGFDIQHQFCGVLLQAFNDKTRQRQQSLIDSQLWPEHFCKPVDAKQASQIANLDLPHSGLFFEAGGWINPRSLIDALLKASRQLTKVDVKLNQTVSELKQNNNGEWQLTSNEVQTQTFNNAVICSGHLANSFEQTKNLGLSPIRGQVSHLDALEQTAKLSTVLCYNGYLTPAVDNQHCIGASFIKDDSNTEIRDKEHLKNLERLKNGLGEQDWFDDLTVPTQGRASIRCASIDHLPMAGAVPNYQQYKVTYQDLWKGLRPNRYDVPPDYDSLYTLTALGARGLCSGPLAAEIIAAQMNNEPYPVSTRVLQALNPGRGYIKQLKAKS